MDTVVGQWRCLLTMGGPAKLALLMPGKDCGSTSDRLDALEKAVSKAAFSRMFGLVLTDNGAEFSDCAAIERSALPGAAKRCSVYNPSRRADVSGNRAAQDPAEGARRGFDRLSGPDCAVLMSHLNSEPRPSLGGMCAIDMLLAAYGDAACSTRFEKVPYGGLLMSPAAIDASAGAARAAGAVAPRNPKTQ